MFRMVQAMGAGGRPLHLLARRDHKSMRDQSSPSLCISRPPGHM
jgi:hypothetical protein